MLQALATLLFLAVGAVAAGVIATMLAANWLLIRQALGLGAVATPDPLPPRYRALTARRVPIMTVREAPRLRAA